MCWRECMLTVDAIKKQLPSRNKGSVALDRWTSTNKFAIQLVIAYYIDWNWHCERYDSHSMRSIDHSFPMSQAHQKLRVTGQHTGARLAWHWKEVLDWFQLTDGRLLGITTDNVSPNDSMTRKLQTTLEASAVEWPSLRNHKPCMAHIVHVALGVVMSGLGVKGRTKSWEAHERDEQFGEIESTDIQRSQSLRKECNASIIKVLAMRPGLAKIFEKVPISTYFEHPETDLHIAENACCIDYADTWLLQQVHWLSKSQSPHRSTTNYGCEDKLELDTGVAQARLPIILIHMGVAWEPKIQRLPTTLHNTAWVDHCQVCHGRFTAIPVLDSVVFKTAYRYSASHHHCPQWHVRSHEWRDVSFA